MNKLEKKLAEIKKEKRTGLMTHVVVGYPDLAITKRLVEEMAAQGADIIELQIPFSDPIADGPTIMKACEEAIHHGTKTKDALSLMSDLSKEVTIPLLFMCYYNTIFAYGREKFIQDAKKSGAEGLIVPDMPLEEEKSEKFMELCDKYGLSHIHVISPESTNARLKKNAKVANGFIYCTARQGITGVKETLDPHLKEYLAHVRNYFSVPLAVGFGIAKKEHIVQIKKYADIAIVGSAIVSMMQGNTEVYLKRIGNFIKDLRKAGS